MPIGADLLDADPPGRGLVQSAGRWLLRSSRASDVGIRATPVVEPLDLDVGDRDVVVLADDVRLPSRNRRATDSGISARSIRWFSACCSSSRPCFVSRLELMSLKAVRQVAELVAGPHVDLGAEVALGDRAHGAQQPVEWGR